MITSDLLPLAMRDAKPGDTLTLSGAFDVLPLKYRPKDLTLDCRKATITGNSRTADVDGLRILGGLWTGSAPLTITRGHGLEMVEPIMRGPVERTGTALAFIGVSDVRIIGAAVSGFRNGLALTEVDGFEVSGGFSDMGVDAVQIAASWNGHVHDLTVHGTRLLPKAHGDGLQLRSIAGKKPTGNILIEDVEITGDCQGVLTTLKALDGGFDNLTLRRVRTRVRYANGVAMLGVRSLVLEDIDVGTYPCADVISRAYVREDCTDVTMRNVKYAAYRNKRAAVLA